MARCLETLTALATFANKAEPPQYETRKSGKALIAALVIVLAACSPQQFTGNGKTTTRLSIVTGGTGGVYYPYGGGIARVITEHLKNVEATAEVTAGTIDNIKFLHNGSADIAFALADSVNDAIVGRGAFVDFGAVNLKVLAVLHTNYTHLVTLANKNISHIGDLKDKVVSTGAPGSGTEITVIRILKAVRLDPESDIRRQRLGVVQSVGALKDHKIDAFFWSGGLPTGSVLDLGATPGRTIKLISNIEALNILQNNYGPSVYKRAVIPKSVYSGMQDDVPVVTVANVLVVHDRMPRQLAYDITRLLFERRADLVAIHAAARDLTFESAIVGSPVPFHEGAVTYYEEQQILKNGSK